MTNETLSNFNSRVKELIDISGKDKSRKILSRIDFIVSNNNVHTCPYIHELLGLKAISK